MQTACLQVRIWQADKMKRVCVSKLSALISQALARTSRDRRGNNGLLEGLLARHGWKNLAGKVLAGSLAVQQDLLSCWPAR